MKPKPEHTGKPAPRWSYEPLIVVRPVRTRRMNLLEMIRYGFITGDAT